MFESKYFLIIYYVTDIPTASLFSRSRPQVLKIKQLSLYKFITSQATISTGTKVACVKKRADFTKGKTREAEGETVDHHADLSYLKFKKTRDFGKDRVTGNKENGKLVSTNYQ